MGKRGCAMLYVPRRCARAFRVLFDLSRDDIACRNQYTIKTSVPTSDEYISPDTKAYEEKGTGFVLQHECAPAWSQSVHEREAD